MRDRISCALLSAVVWGCSGDTPAPIENPAADAGTQGEETPDASTQQQGQPTCAPTPTRLVVLGDSIVACSVMGGPNGPDCASRMLHEHMDTTYAEGLAYENKAVGGAVTHDVVASQLASVDVGQPGHVLAMIYVGGNDLQRFLFQSDAQAETGFRAKLPEMLADWDTIHAFFADTANFPDGATVVMNRQYNPFDDCTAMPYNLSELKIGLLHEYNDAITAVADEHLNTAISYQDAAFLGHGHHYNVSACPHYKDGMVPWMKDLIHPNPAGNRGLNEQWQQVTADIYRCE